MAFPRTTITIEREEILDHQRDSGKYDRAADGDWENCVRSHGAYLEGDWDIIFLCKMFLVSYSFFSKCLYFSRYMAGYFLDRPQRIIYAKVYLRPLSSECLGRGRPKQHCHFKSSLGNSYTQPGLRTTDVGWSCSASALWTFCGGLFFVVELSCVLQMFTSILALYASDASSSSSEATKNFSKRSQISLRDRMPPTESH